MGSMIELCMFLSQCFGLAPAARYRQTEQALLPVLERCGDW